MRGKQDRMRERELRQNQTEAERILWGRLRGRRLLGARFRRQHRIGPYFADFACPELQLVVELDGSQHLEQVAYDGARTDDLCAAGYRVLRFWNDDVIARTEQVLDAIARCLASKAR